jgi:hypothetical protein
MKRALALLLLVLFTTGATAPANSPADRIAMIATARDLPASLHPDTIEARFQPLVTLARKPPGKTPGVVVFTDWGMGSSVWVRRALARFQPDGRARVQFEFTPSPDLTFDKLAASIEAQRGAPAENVVLRRTWTAPAGQIQLFTAKASDNGDDVLVLELMKSVPQ